MGGLTTQVNQQIAVWSNAGQTRVEVNMEQSVGGRDEEGGQTQVKHGSKSDLVGERNEEGGLVR